MFRKIIFLSFIIYMTFVGSSYAKIEFKELEDDAIIAYVNGLKVNAQDLKKVKGESSEHVAGLHRNKADRVSDRIYLKGMLDSYLVISEAISKGYEKSSEYGNIKKSVDEMFILNKYIKSEVLDKIDEKDETKKQKILNEIMEKKPDECRKNCKIEVKKELIKREKLSENYDKNLIVAKVNDYEILMEDVIRAVSPYRLDNVKPNRLYQEYLDKALENLIKRAIVFNEAIKLGYGKDIPPLTQPEHYDLLKKAYKLKEYNEISVSEGDIEKMFTENKDYYIRKFLMAKYGIILKTKKEEIEKIKERLAKGEDFFQIAVKESEDKTKETGGIQDYINRISPEIKDILIKLKDGEVSDINSLDNVYFIIKRLDLRFDDLEELKAIIDNDIRAEKIKRSDVLDTIREKANIIINSKLMKEKDFYSDGTTDEASDVDTSEDNE